MINRIGLGPETMLIFLNQAIKDDKLKEAYPNWEFGNMNRVSSQRWLVFCLDRPSSSKPKFWYCGSDEQAILSLQSGELFHYPTDDEMWDSMNWNVYGGAPTWHPPFHMCDSKPEDLIEIMCPSVARVKGETHEYTCSIPAQHKCSHVGGPHGAVIVWDDNGYSPNYMPIEVVKKGLTEDEYKAAFQAKLELVK